MVRFIFILRTPIRRTMGGKLAESVVILLSGGIDSTACISYYQTQGLTVRGLFVDYGQAPAASERKSASDVARHYGIALDCMVVTSETHFSDGEIPGRNAFLVFCALMNYPDFNGILSLGIHSGTPYYDCSKPFVLDTNRILAGYRVGMVTLDAPFLEWSKSMIYAYCRQEEVPVGLTYSCEKCSDKPCGTCRSCLDRGALDGTI